MSRRHTFIVIGQELGTPNSSHAQNVMVDFVARMKLKRPSRYFSWLLTGSVEDIYTRRASVAGGTAAQNAGRPGKHMRDLWCVTKLFIIITIMIYNSIRGLGR